jgi:type III pantothenate kinase
MNLTIDLGNTFAKVGIFDHRDLKEKALLKGTAEVSKFIQNFSGQNIIISSVNADPTVFLEACSHLKNVVILSQTTAVPVEIKYKTPATLGVDRLAAACGALDLFPGSNCLVVDAGTCITCEFIDAQGRYWGGAISPGLSMRFKAMNAFTARLPLVEPVENPPLTGDSTVSSMQSGVIFGIMDELDGAIKRYSEKFEDLKVILTGGDCRFFENKLKGSIFAIPELVLRGLNSILLYNIRD